MLEVLLCENYLFVVFISNLILLVLFYSCVNVFFFLRYHDKSNYHGIFFGIRVIIIVF
jgi:hypothetical protein